MKVFAPNVQQITKVKAFRIKMIVNMVYYIKHVLLHLLFVCRGEHIQNCSLLSSQNRFISLLLSVPRFASKQKWRNCLVIYKHNAHGQMYHLTKDANLGIFFMWLEAVVYMTTTLCLLHWYYLYSKLSAQFPLPFERQ